MRFKIKDSSVEFMQQGSSYVLVSKAISHATTNPSPITSKKNYVLFGRHVPKTMSEFYELVEHNSKRKEDVKNEQSYINIKIFINFFSIFLKTYRNQVTCRTFSLFS